MQRIETPSAEFFGTYDLVEERKRKRDKDPNHVDVTYILQYICIANYIGGAAMGKQGLNGMRQLILRIPDKAHRNLRILAAAKEKTMTDVVIDWIQRESDAMTNDPLLRALQSESGLPTRDYSEEEVDGFLRADDETPEDLKEWARKKAGEKPRK